MTISIPDLRIFLKRAKAGDRVTYAYRPLSWSFDHSAEDDRVFPYVRGVIEDAAPLFVSFCQKTDGHVVYTLHRVTAQTIAWMRRIADAS